MVYLLKCDTCGRENEIVLRQAGESIGCACGVQLEIPTLREIRKLPEMEDRTLSSGRSWSRAQGVLFTLGLLVTVLTVIAASYAMYWRSSLYVEPLTAKDVTFLLDMDVLTPTMAWDAWVKQFRDYDLGSRQEPIHIANRKLARNLLISSIVAAIMAALGLAAMVAATLMKPNGGRGTA